MYYHELKSTAMLHALCFTSLWRLAKAECHYPDITKIVASALRSRFARPRQSLFLLSFCWSSCSSVLSPTWCFHELKILVHFITLSK